MPPTTNIEASIGRASESDDRHAFLPTPTRRGRRRRPPGASVPRTRRERHVRSLRLQPAGPRTSSRSSRSSTTGCRRPSQADYNVAPTKEVYAVVERPPSRGGRRAGACRRAQLRRCTWGLVPSWAKDPKIGSRMINARMETVAEKPAFRRAFAVAALPAAGRRLLRVVPHRSSSASPASRSSSRSSSGPSDGGVLAMAGLYEIWRDPDKADDDPDRFRWTCTVITTDAEDDVGHIHDRMPLMVEQDRWSSWLDPTITDKDDAARPAGARGARARSRPTRCPRRSATCATTAPSWWSRCRSTTSPSWLTTERMPAEQRVGTPHGDGRLVTYRAAPAGRHAAAQPRRRQGHRHPRPARRWPRALPRQGISVRAVRAAVAGGRAQGRQPAGDARRGLRRGRRLLRTRTPLVVGGRRAGARSAARTAARPRRGRLPGAGVPAAPAGPAREVPARRAARRRA